MYIFVYRFFKHFVSPTPFVSIYIKFIEITINFYYFGFYPTIFNLVFIKKPFSTVYIPFLIFVLIIPLKRLDFNGISFFVSHYYSLWLFLLFINLVQYESILTRSVFPCFSTIDSIYLVTFSSLSFGRLCHFFVNKYSIKKTTWKYRSVYENTFKKRIANKYATINIHPNKAIPIQLNIVLSLLLLQAYVSAK